ncbi:uncharacterized protein LOC110223210 [Phascolarctos cinereus]
MQPQSRPQRQRRQRQRQPRACSGEEERLAGFPKQLTGGSAGVRRPGSTGTPAPERILSLLSPLPKELRFLECQSWESPSRSPSPAHSLSLLLHSY